MFEPAEFPVLSKDAAFHYHSFGVRTLTIFKYFLLLPAAFAGAGASSAYASRNEKAAEPVLSPARRRD